MFSELNMSAGLETIGSQLLKALSAELKVLKYFTRTMINVQGGCVLTKTMTT